MTILTRYITREFLRWFLLCLLGLVLLYLLVDFVEKTDLFGKKDATGMQVLLYFANKLPLMFFQVMPFSLLIATLVALMLLSKTSEIIAMMAGGLSLYRIAAPILVTALAISGFSALLNEYVVPGFTERANYIMDVDIKGKKERVRKKIKDRWYKHPGGIYHVRVYRKPTETLEGFVLFELDRKFRITRRIDAAQGRWTGEGWELAQGTDVRFEHGRVVSSERFERLPIDLPATPRDFATIPKEAEEMSYRELQVYIERIRDEGLDVTPYEVDLQGKLSFPAVGFIMALLAVPFALRTGRQGGVALGFGIAVIVAVAFWLTMAAFMAYGDAGNIPPALAAWGSQAIFFAVGVGMIVRVGR